MQTRQEEKLLNSNRHYSLRKLSVGLASVLIGISFLNGTKTTVKADTIANNNDEYAKAHENNESSESTQDALLKNTGVAEGNSVQTGEASKAGNLEVAGNSKDLSAFSMPFNGKNDGNETAKADTTSDQTTHTSDAQTMATRNEKQQASSVQNSAAELQKDLLANTENNQAEANNQENRLTDQINYKLVNQDSTDNKKDSGQNLTVPDKTKQAPITKSDAEKNITQSSSTQQVNNPSSNHVEDSSQTQNSQKLDLTKNRQLAKRMLAVNLIETNALPTTNGGFDEATWGKLDVNNWQGSVQDGVYELTKYTGDPLHIIVPNAADFEQAGKSTNGLQVGITRDTVHSLLLDQTQTIAFSKTNNQKVKSIGTDWSYAFSNADLSKFDGSALDVSNVMDMHNMFASNKVSDLTSLANWNVSNVTNMREMFASNTINDLTPLANWNVSNVTNMREMFAGNTISDLTPLAHWDTSNVISMNDMFGGNKISDLTPLAKWDTSKITDMNDMFYGNSISDLTPLAYWDVSNVTNMNDMFYGNSISDLTSLAHWDTSKVTDMSYMFVNNKISDLSPLANWNIINVTDMSNMFVGDQISNLTPLAHWNTGNVTNMSYMFANNKISDLSPLANWNVSNVTDMHNMFAGNTIGNLTSLAHWDTSKVTNMSKMFTYNSISNLTSLANWNISKATNMSGMFSHNKISDLTPLANWDISKATNMSSMFGGNPDLIDLKPIANWNINSVKYNNSLFAGDTKLDLTNINNTPLMQSFLKMPVILASATFITNNTDFVKATVGQDLPILTNTAKRTIVFNFPNGTHETVNQIINYKVLAPVQIDWPAMMSGGFSGGAGSSSIVGGGSSSGTGSSVIIGGSGSSSDGGFHYELGGGGFSSGTGSSVVVGGHGSSSGGAGGSAGGAGGASGSGSFSGGGSNVIINEKMRMAFASFARVGAPVQTGSDGPKIIKTYSAEDVKESDWQLDDSKPNDDVIIDGVICFKPVQIPHINGYKPYIIKNPVNPAMFLVSFFAVPEQLQNKQSNHAQLPQKPVQPEQKQLEQKQPEQKQSGQKQSEQKQSEQKQPEQKPVQPIQTKPADDKQVDQAINHISYTLMHNDSTFDNANSFEPVQNDSAPFEDVSDSTQKDDATKIVNAAKPKKHIAKKHVVKRHKKHAKKYHLKRRLRKHTKRSRHAKKRIIKHRKSVSRKFRKFHLKHIKKA